MSKSIVRDKSYMFAIRIVKLYKVLNEKKEFVLSKQLLRSGTAIGALIKEAEHAQSRADFVNKMNIALKEANESEYWIMLLRDTDFLTETEYISIISDCRELVKLTICIVRSSKKEKNMNNIHLVSNNCQLSLVNCQLK